MFPGFRVFVFFSIIHVLGVCRSLTLWCFCFDFAIMQFCFQVWAYHFAKGTSGAKNWWVSKKGQVRGTR